MATFWPWIGKQQIKSFYRFTGQQITHSVRTFHSQQADVFQWGGFTRGNADPIEQPFDPQKVFVRHSLRQRAKKRTIAAAKIDVQWCFASENFLQVETVGQRIELDYPKRDVPAVS